MATTKLYDLAVKTGTYTDGGGQEKGRWLNVGSVMQTDDGGKFIMLNKTFNPAGVPDLSGRNSESVLLSMFEPKGANQPAQQPAAQTPKPNPPAQGFDDIDSDIPFQVVEAKPPRQYAVEILQLKTKEERREALSKVPENLRPIVKTHVQNWFRLTNPKN